MPGKGEGIEVRKVDGAWYRRSSILTSVRWHPMQQKSRPYPLFGGVPGERGGYELVSKT